MTKFCVKGYVPGQHFLIKISGEKSTLWQQLHMFMKTTSMLLKQNPEKDEIFAVIHKSVFGNTESSILIQLATMVQLCSHFLGVIPMSFLNISYVTLQQKGFCFTMITILCSDTPLCSNTSIYSHTLALRQQGLWPSLAHGQGAILRFFIDPCIDATYISFIGTWGDVCCSSSSA